MTGMYDLDAQVAADLVENLIVISSDDFHVDVGIVGAGTGQRLLLNQRDTGRSCDAARLPEFDNFVIRDDLSLQTPRHGSAFIISHDVGTGSPSLDFTRRFGELFLILAGPKTHAFEHGFDLFLGHGGSLP